MGEERLEGLGWEGEPQRSVLKAWASSARKGSMSWFISFCLLYSHNSVLPVELEGLGWEGEPQRSVLKASSATKGIMSWLISICLL